MANRMGELVDAILALEQDLERELEQKQSEFRYRLEKRRAIFEQEMLHSQRQLKLGLFQLLRKTKLRTLLSTPFIYGLALPLVMVDLAVTLYQRVCFLLWGIAPVRRSDYWVMDRGQLAYLNLIEKVNCVYCSYANGLAAYIREVASRTEQFWCPIKHASRVHHPHSRYWHFSDFGDAAGYRTQLQHFRSQLREMADKQP